MVIDSNELPDVGLSEDYWKALLEQSMAGPALPASLDEPHPISGAEASSENGLGRAVNRREEALWDQLEAWHQSGEEFVAPVIGCNKGGLLVRVCDGLGFVPASQLIELPRSLGTPDLRADLEKMVGQEMTLRLIEIDRHRDRVICSQRATQWQGGDVDDRLQALVARIGQDVEGVVRSICDFGVFLDLGGVDGLIHISELSWQRVNHPSDMARLDQRMLVRILNVDLEGRRVGLSLKRLHDDPWKLVGERYAVGDIIDVTVTNVVHFGAFAQVDEGVEGLIHISELSGDAFMYAQQVVSEGQEVQARILHIDPKARRLGLSIRQA
jgi:small subunit ribosomal protein S1